MAVQLLPLCEVPKLATRDGYAGANASLYLPFYGYWFADGKQLAFPQSVVAQNPSPVISGEYKELPFTKAAGVCVTTADAPGL